MHQIEHQIIVTVNGLQESVASGLAIPVLCKTLGYNPRLIAIEYNGEILHRQYWDTTVVQSGDRLEIVTIVGGG